MGIKLNKQHGIKTLDKANQLAMTENYHREWELKIRKFSELSKKKSVYTHITFLGTAILAKAMNPSVDVFSVKAKDDSEGAYSARSLAHDVLVPQAVNLNFDLGRRGREPLNNQPYFRILRVTSDIPTRQKEILDLLINFLTELNNKPQTVALKILASFIKVRSDYLPNHSEIIRTAGTSFTFPQVKKVIKRFLIKSEGGKRAQAACAAALKVAFPNRNLNLGKINDPDRNMPGDLGLYAGKKLICAFEVRDKTVSISDIQIFIKKLYKFDIHRGGIICLVGSDVTNFNEDINNQMLIPFFIYNSYDAFLNNVFMLSHPNFDFKSLFQNLHTYLLQQEVEESTIEELNNLLKEFDIVA